MAYEKQFKQQNVSFSNPDLEDVTISLPPLAFKGIRGWFKAMLLDIVLTDFVAYLRPHLHRWVTWLYDAGAATEDDVHSLLDGVLDGLVNEG